MESTSDFQRKVFEEKRISDDTRQKIIEDFKQVNQKVRELRNLKEKHRVNEQQVLLSNLKNSYHSYRNISSMSGIGLKTVHSWAQCSKKKVHKAKELANLRKKEFENFLLQDTISFAHPAKKYSKKCFLRDTMEITRQKYLQQPEYHTHGVISLSTMKEYRPANIMLCSNTPLDQCLCDKCENCEQILKALHAVGLRSIPSNRYAAVNSVLCECRHKQFGSEFTFAGKDCVLGNCQNCGKSSLEKQIRDANSDALVQNRNMSWRKWVSIAGKSAQEKSQIKGTIQQALRELLNMLKLLKSHLFRANWNRNLFDYMRKNLLPGYVVQIFDFSQNYRNWNQDEVQSAYWEGTQTAIHAVINYYVCENSGCSETVTLILAQITDDLKHDSFVARAGHDSAFRYLAEIGVPLDVIVQFCDNCGSQYKSRRPFAELARTPLNIIRVYFGEKHGKSQCDGFFGRLKAWVTHKIKTRQFIITNAHEFYRCCKEEYETPPAESGKCQHYRVKFQFLKKNQIRRHQDCDLDQAVEGTLSMYSVRNTPHPLQLKVRNTPCLCPPCIADDGGTCRNATFTDPWRDVELIPVKGESRRKHLKRKHPKDYVSAQCTEIREDVQNNDVSSDEEIGDINIVNLPTEVQEAEPVIDLTEQLQQDENPVFIDLTEKEPSRNDEMDDCDTDPLENNDVIITKDGEDNSSQIPDIYAEIESEDIPDRIYWESILGRLERCRTDAELHSTAIELQKTLKPLRPRKKGIHFRCEVDYIDSVAAESIPEDAPNNVDAIMILPDGNCFSRSISHVWAGNDSMHIEMCACIVLEGITNKNSYTSHQCLARGCNFTHYDEPIPHMYVRFSDFYVNGQKITDSTVDYIYSREIHDSAKLNSYMGLWQIAQASTVLNTPIQSVYPTTGDPLFRQHFNRYFFPITNGNAQELSDKIVIMWTSSQKNWVPNHFIPLLPKRNKYGFMFLFGLVATLNVYFIFQH